MSPTLHPKRHDDVDPEANPTGEQLLNRLSRPYRVWVPTGKSLVLGNSQDPEKELNVGPVMADAIPVFKRMSGGGAVLLSPGCLCLGLRFAKRSELSIQDYFTKGSGLIRAIVAAKLGLELHSRGISDLVGGAGRETGLRKVAGCAMYMPRDFVLYLVSILVTPDFGDMEKYLSHPSKEPEYRAGRSHGEFLSGLALLAGKPVLPTEMIPWFEAEIPAALGPELDWALCGIA